MRKIYTVCLIVVTCMACKKGENYLEDNQAVPPEKAVSTFRMAPGFQLELVAHEPAVMDPVDMEIDENGHLYVVEMPGYPLDKGATGRINRLVDEDGDGFFEEKVPFADNLMFPNGILRWKKGFIVTDASYVLYLEDSDGDGWADIRDTLLTGFSLSNPHVNVNNPVYGLDNWIYLAHLGHIGAKKYADEFGDRGSEVFFPKNPAGPKLPQNAKGLSVRFKPDSYQLEMNSSRTQFGHTFDPWGRYLLTHNQNHIYQEVVAARYMDRNPDLLFATATASISDHGSETEVFQITTHPDRQLFTPTGLTTSSSGITAYTGGLFPEPFDKAVFVAESVSNLVHVDLLKENGAAYQAVRHKEDAEFMASTDSWARPVNMYVGPDGALYVLDYYRKIIEHPEWMSDEAVEAGGLYEGLDKGRIYRVTPQGTDKAAWTKGIDLANQRPEDWVKHLENPNSWWRTHAQRLLVDTQDASAIPLLEKMLTGSTSSLGRLHALWTLHGLNALQPTHVAVALKDKEAGVRENGIRLAEDFLNHAEVTDVLLGMHSDTDARVRFQLLCTLGFLDTRQAEDVRQRLLFEHLSDEWFHVAALSAKNFQPMNLLNQVLASYETEIPEYRSLARKLTVMVVGKGDTNQQLANLFSTGLKPENGVLQPKQLAVLDGLAEGVRGKNLGREGEKMASALAGAFFDIGDPQAKQSILRLLQSLRGAGDIPKKWMDQAAEIVQDVSLSADERSIAVRFLALGDITGYEAMLKGLLDSKETVAVQLAAVDALGKLPGEGISFYFLKLWDTFLPQVKDAALDTYFSSSERVKILLDGIEGKVVAPSALGWKRRVQIMNQADEQLQRRARALLTVQEGEEVIKSFQKALALKGDPVAGKSVFMAECSLCHQYKGSLGVPFGPDLGTVHNWLAADLLANILDPGLSIAPGFDLWELTLVSGEKVQGMILEETSSAINLRLSPGVEKLISRQDISQLTGLPSSLMPDLSSQLDHQQMADLLAFLRQKGY